MQVHWSHDIDSSALSDLDLGSRLNQIFLVNAFPLKPSDQAASKFTGAYVIWCRGYWATVRVYPLPKVKVKSEIMYFLVNASPKRLDLATPNFADALVSSKAGISDGVPSTEV